jgi:hypothetical protein
MSTPSTDLVVVQMTRARRALLEAQTIQATKRVLDIAIAAEVYARRHHLSKESVALARSIHIEALAQLGRMLKKTNLAKGGQPYQKKKNSTGSSGEPVEPTLADLGLNKHESFDAQFIASLPTEEVELLKAGKKSKKQVKKEKVQKEAQKKVAGYVPAKDEQR